MRSGTSNKGVLRENILNPLKVKTYRIIADKEIVICQRVVKDVKALNVLNKT